MNTLPATLNNTVDMTNYFIQLLLDKIPAIGLIFVLTGIAMIFYHTHSIGKLDWSNLITNKGTNIISLSKCLQLIGGITGTWMVVYLTLHDKLSFDILLVYLGYVGGVEGFSKFLAAKYNINVDHKEPEKEVIKESEKISTDPNIVT